jgi:tetratricopeptide (TPR) repeat protein
MKLRKFIAAFGLVCSMPLMAQTSDNGFYLLKMGQLKGAKEVFSKNIAQNSLDSRSFYGLGEYYLKLNNIDSADANFQKGITVNKSDAFNYIGLAKIAFLKKDNLAAAAKLDLARKYGKKDVTVFTEIARVYLAQEEKNQEEITKAIAKAKDINSRCSDIYLLLAKIAADKNDFSSAANQYESSIYFDSTEFEAYIGYSRILVAAQNSNSAVGYLNTLIRKSPECIIAYRELGDVLFNLGKYSESSQNYAKYIEKAEYLPEEKEQYAYSLFFSKEYDKAKEIIAQLSDNNPDNYIMLRLLAYTDFQQEKYEDGVVMFNNFFSKIPENKILTLDYEFFAKTLEMAKMDSLAAIQYQNAYTKDSTKSYLLEAMAKCYSRAKVYGKAVEVNNKIFQLKKNPQAKDYYQLAYSYYAAGSALQATADSAAKRVFLLKGDTLFGTVSSLSPKWHIPVLLRARTNSILDPETTKGLAKPYYDKTLEIITATPDKYKREIIEAYSYMGYYYFQKSDYTTSKSYWEKILVLDPTNAAAIQAMSVFNKK